MRKSILLLAAAVCMTVLTAAPAQAVPAGLQIVGVASGVGPGTKSVFVPCPTGKKVTGGGGYLIANPPVLGMVGIDRVEPAANLSGFTVTMRTPTVPPNWQMQAKAVCANPIAGAQRVEATNAPPPGGSSVSTVTPPCDTGKKVIGVGARVNNGNSVVYIDDVIPSAATPIVTARAHLVPGFANSSWSLTAYAICAPNPAGWHIAFPSSLPHDSSSHKSKSHSCPAGEGVYSAGFQLWGTDGSVIMTGVNNFALGTASAWADEYLGAYGNDWHIDLYLICGT